MPEKEEEGKKVMWVSYNWKEEKSLNLEVIEGILDI